jgi:hypothetical protein
MTSIALIAEGTSDQIVLENILIGIIGDPDLSVRMAQPTLDDTDASRKRGAGGWTEVFRFCKSPAFADAFATNEFVVIQIDTDTCEETGYNVPVPRKNNRVDVEQLIADISDRICEEIDSTILTEVRKRIIFAICVDEIECWLLPLWCNERAHAGKITGCLAAINIALKKAGEDFYVHAKSEDYYRELSKGYKKRAAISRHSKRNPSLNLFVQAVRNTVFQ